MHKMKKSLGRLLATGAVAVCALALAACQAPTANSPTTPTVAVASGTAAPGAPSAEPGPMQPTPTPMTLAGATKTTSGLQYLEEKAGAGEAPKAGSIITMQYIATLADGTELANTYTTNEPVDTVWGAQRLLPGWEEGIGLMKVGGKAKLLLPPELAFGASGSGSIPPNAQVMIEVELLGVKDAPTPTTVKAEALTKTDSGLEYADLVEGSGMEAAKNSSVSTHYSLWVKTGTGYDYIDQSNEKNPVDFVVGRGDTVFPGWEEGVTGMKEGGKRLLVIPPALGMGAQGAGLVPADAVLVMEIQLVDVREPRVATQVDATKFTTTPSGLKYYDLTPGTGDSPKAGQTVVVHYTGWLEDGTQFDSSLDRGEPFSFQLGMQNVIEGWDEGVAGMKVGGKRQLLIPPALAYKEAGAGNVIPPNATLIFEVELLEIQ